jgi:subtilase family serine protease
LGKLGVDMRPHFKLAIVAGFVSAAAIAMPESGRAQSQPIQFLRPDLVIGSLRVEPDILPFVAGNQVKRGQPFQVCYAVSNIGLKASGGFRVNGSGFFPRPFQDHAGLAPGESRGGCLQYPRARVQGSRTLTLKADSRNVIAESNEGNNTATVNIVVLP